MGQFESLQTELLSELSELSAEEIRLKIHSMHPIDSEDLYNVLFLAKIISNKLDTIKGEAVIMTWGTARNLDGVLV